MRKILVYKLNGEIIAEQSINTHLDEINKFKYVIAEELDCKMSDIEVSTEILDKEYSNIDVTPEGLIIFDENCKIITGLKCLVNTGSDSYLDALVDGTILQLIIFDR